MKWIRFQPTELLSLSILLSVASFFRFYDLSEKLVFQGDQGRALLAARDILAGNLPLIGPETSVSGFHLGPFFYYLIAPALWLAHYDPLGPAVLTAFFGVATVLLLFFYGRRFFSSETGFVMALLFALSPHAIWQSRIALEPSPVPFFSALWLLAITEWLFTKRSKWLLLSGLSLLLGVQLNFSFASLVPTTAWLAIPTLPMNNKARYALQAVTLFCLGLLVIARSALRPVTSWEYFLHIWTELTLPQLPQLALALLPLGLMLTGLLLWKESSSGVRTQHLLPAFAWLVFALAGFMLKYVSGEHSLALLFPAPAVFTGIAVFLFTQKNQMRKNFVVAGVFLLSLPLAFQAWQYLNTKKTTTLAEYQEVTEHILQLANGEPYRFLYRGHLDVYDAADDQYQYLLWKEGNAPVESYRREITEVTRDTWNTQALQPEKTIVLYQPPFHFSEYTGFGDAHEWNGRWFAVRDETP